MSEEKTRMVNALKTYFVPKLKALGFKGSFPHYRRGGKGDSVDLLMFQFNKYGGGFTVEISGVRENIENRNFVFKKEVDPKNVKVSDMNLRMRLKPDRHDGWFNYFHVARLNKKVIITVKPSEKAVFENEFQGNIEWIQIADECIYTCLAKELAGYIPAAEEYWRELGTAKKKSIVDRILGR